MAQKGFSSNFLQTIILYHLLYHLIFLIFELPFFHRIPPPFQIQVVESEAWPEVILKLLGAVFISHDDDVVCAWMSRCWK